MYKIIASNTDEKCMKIIFDPLHGGSDEVFGWDSDVLIKSDLTDIWDNVEYNSSTGELKAVHFERDEAWLVVKVDNVANIASESVLQVAVW